MSKAGNLLPNEDRQAQRLKHYFAKYPGRDGTFARLLFRRGERERFDLLDSWLPEWDDLSVLDAGCGDGIFLSHLIAGRPRLLRLEDFVDKWTSAAAERLHDAADSVQAVTTDVRRNDDDCRYDIVLALGVFDYTADWPELMQSLLARSCGRVVVDFPRRGTLHSLLRRSWLKLRGVRLYPACRDDLESLFSGAGVEARIEGLPLQWLALIDLRHK